jgi:hypothetical protein
MAWEVLQIGCRPALTTAARGAKNREAMTQPSLGNGESTGIVRRPDAAGNASPASGMLSDL